MREIIDTHGYFGKNKTLGLDEHPSIFSGLKRRIKEQYGLNVRFMIMPYSMQDNQLLPSIVSRNPEVFAGGLLQINPNPSMSGLVGHTPTQDLEMIIKAGGIVGLKLHTSATGTSVDDKRLTDYAKLAADYRLPILVHCGATGQDYTSPDKFRQLRDRNYEVAIICAHYGGLNDDYIPHYIELVQEDPLMYLNTSGLTGQIKRWDFKADPPTSESIENLGRWDDLFLGTIDQIYNKVIFGSDFPELDFSLDPISRAEKNIQDAVLHKNAEKLFLLS